MALPLLLSFLGSGLAKAGVLGAAGSFLANPLVMGAIGSGLGTAIETGDVKKGLLGGLGSFAGGKLLGGVLGGAGGAGGGAAAAATPLPGQSVVGQGAGAMTAGAPLQATPGMAGLMPPPAQAPKGIMGLFGDGRVGDVVRGGMNFAQSGEGIGSMLGGTLAAGAGDLFGKPKGPDTGREPNLANIRPMQRTPNTPPAGYQHGLQPEFDYGVSTPYNPTMFADKYGPTRKMAMGGPVRKQLAGMAPVYLQAGGLAELERAKQPENEKDVVAGAIAAVKGQHPNPEIALGAFLAKFGEDALRNLVDRVQSGEMDETAARSEGQLAGPGDGMSDTIPASIGGQQDVLLSDGEYIVPADVVSGLGNGSSAAGAKELDALRDRVREGRTGTKEQAPPIRKEEVMPA